MSDSLKDKALVLRKQGYLYSDIANELGVSKSSARRWTINAELTLDQKNLIETKYKNRVLTNIATLSDLNRKRREAALIELRDKAVRIVQSTDFSMDYRRVLCAVIFWCEGGKDLSSGVYFINSDPALVDLYLRLLRQSFELDETRFHGLIHLHDYHNTAEILDFWSSLTQIPKDQFYKPYIKAHPGVRKREGYKGCISIRYSDASLGKLLKMIYSELSQI